MANSTPINNWQNTLSNNSWVIPASGAINWKYYNIQKIYRELYIKYGGKDNWGLQEFFSLLTGKPVPNMTVIRISRCVKCKYGLRGSIGKCRMSDNFQEFDIKTAPRKNTNVVIDTCKNEDEI